MNNRILSGLVAVFAILISSTSLAATQEVIERVLEEQSANNQVIGACIGYIENGLVSFATHGYLSENSTKRVSKDTIFEIGSITKTITTLLLINETKKKQITLIDPIEKYYPGIKLPKIQSKKNMLVHLATHTSEFSSVPSNFNPKNCNNPYIDYTQKNLESFLKNYQVKDKGKREFIYSNFGMGLLGNIISKQTGKSYEQLVVDMLSRDLDMKDTCISIPENKLSKFAIGHDKGIEVCHWDIPVLAGAGALRSTLKDMIKFLSANMGYVKSPLTDSLKLCHKKRFEIQPNLYVGLGWIICDLGDSEIIWHNGETGGFSSFIGFNPKTRKGVVILSNSSGDWPTTLGLKMLDPKESPTLEL